MPRMRRLGAVALGLNIPASSCAAAATSSGLVVEQYGGFGLKISRFAGIGAGRLRLSDDEIAAVKEAQGRSGVIVMDFGTILRRFPPAAYLEPVMTDSRCVVVLTCLPRRNVLHGQSTARPPLPDCWLLSVWHCSLSSLQRVEHSPPFQPRFGLIVCLLPGLTGKLLSPTELVELTTQFGTPEYSPGAGQILQENNGKTDEALKEEGGAETEFALPEDDDELLHNFIVVISNPVR